MLSNRKRKAFTLLELIVVIVIIGVLAGLSVPTFKEVIKRSQLKTAAASAESFGRDAIALAAFEDGVVTNAHLGTVASETNGKVVLSDYDGLDNLSDRTATIIVKGEKDVKVALTFGTNTAIAVPSFVNP